MSVSKLISLITKTNNPSVVGLDPDFDQIPEFLRLEAINEHGATLEAAACALLRFNKTIIDHICDIVPAVKPQSAYYEALGLPGLQCLEQTVAYAQQKGMYVILDVKRGDIGSTCEAYANSYLQNITINGVAQQRILPDAVTVNPYLGRDGLQPFVFAANLNEKCVFILVKTSNASSIEVQDLKCEDTPVYEHVAKIVDDLAGQSIGSCNYSNVGAVVGATFPKQAAELREKLPFSYFLVPGYGAQGATAKHVVSCFDKNGLGAIVNSSRKIIYAYQKNRDKQEDFGQFSRDAALEMKNDINNALEVRA